MSASEKAKQALQILKDTEHNAAVLADKALVNKNITEAKEWGLLAKFWFTVTASLVRIFRKVIVPVYSFLSDTFALLFFRPWMRLWNYYTYIPTDSGVLRFSSVRGAYLIFVTIAMSYAAVASFSFMFDTALYFTTSRHNEVVYLSNAQEIDPEGNIHSVQGCETSQANTCDAYNSLYFRVEPSAFNHLWSLVHKQTLFLPDYVAAPVAPGWGKCTITSYGIRVKFLMRNWEVYPKLLEATCQNVQ